MQQYMCAVDNKKFYSYFIAIANNELAARQMVVGALNDQKSIPVENGRRPYFDTRVLHKYYISTIRNCEYEIKTKKMCGSKETEPMIFSLFL